MPTFNIEPAERLLDDVGLNILFELQENARISFSELGRRVGLTAPAVAERVRRMEEAGIITGYHAHVDPEKLGLPITAYLHVDTTDQSCRSLTHLLQEVPEVLECHRITGDDDLLIKVSVSSVSHLQALLDRIVEFGTISTSLVLSSAVRRRSIR